MPVTSVIMAVVNAVHGHEGEVTGMVNGTSGVAGLRGGQQDQQDQQDRQAASRLLGVEGLAVTDVACQADGSAVVQVVTDDACAAACPGCGVFSTALKQRVTTRPRDVPYGDRTVRLVWRKSRWRCRERTCARESFTESVAQVPPGARLTRRLREQVGKGACETFSCVASAAAHYAVSWPTAMKAAVEHMSAGLAGPLPVVPVIGIDETRRGKTVWEQHPDTDKWRIRHDRWHTSIVDAHGHQGLLGHIDGRTSAAVIAWLDTQPQSWRDGVDYVCMDLCAPYAAAVRRALPGAVVVADRFHLVALANTMITDVRQRVTREHLGRRGRKTDLAWRSRRKLLMAAEKLDPDVLHQLRQDLQATGISGQHILDAHAVKEALRELLGLSGTNPARSTIAHRLFRFYQLAADADHSPEITRLATTITTWWPAIEAAILTGHSNARSEGYNRIAKHTARDAFGFRNVTNHRLRVRWACTRQRRRVSARNTKLPYQV